MNVPQMKFKLPIGQWADIDGVLMRFKHRARDVEQCLVFESMEGVPLSMTDRELLDFQHGGDRRLRMLTALEASDVLEQVGRPRVTFAANDDGVADQARLRLDYCLAWERAGSPARTEGKIAALVQSVFVTRRDRDAKPREIRAPSPRQVLRWISSWVSSGGDIEALVPQTANRGNTKDRLAPVARSILEETVDKYYLQDTQPTASSVHGHVRTKFCEHNAALPKSDWLPVPSLRAVHRCIARIDHYTLDFSRLGRRKADHKWRPTGSAPPTTRHNEVWETDHTVVDAIILDETTKLPIGRPWVTVTLDRHTRMVTGIYIGFDPPGTYRTMECLRMAILPKDNLLAKYPEITGVWPAMGHPETLIPDQGREFKAHALVTACVLIGTDVQYTPILKAWYKGKVERFFGTLTTDVFQRLPGTTFSNFFERNAENIPEKVAVVTLEELRLHTIRWIVDVYSRRRHRGMMGVSPLEAWHESVRKHGMRALPDPDRITAALSAMAFRVPQRYGIEYEGLIYNSADVAAYRIRSQGDRSVRITVDPLDLSSISFLDSSTNQFIRVPIRDSQRELVRGITLEQHKLGRALQRSNPANLSGDEGLARAYGMIDEAMLKLGVDDGLANRRKAAAFREKLVMAQRPEDAPAFDTVASAKGVGEELFNQPFGAPQDFYDDPEDPAPAGTTNARKTRVPHTPRAEPTQVPPVDPAADDDEIAAFMKSTGMSLKMTSNGGGR